jgi:hypothetical protein
MAEQLRHEDFAPHVGKRFHFAGMQSALHLVAVDMHDHGLAPGVTRPPFTLLFHGPVGDVLPEGLYRVDIEDGPTLDFYIMPIHTVAPGRQEYQAVFN